jgi:predicted Rossmann fold nucleotide-binding protein DprA/Smf involved in DNA uptake
MTACAGCLRRTALVARLAPHIERARRQRRKLTELLALTDEDMIAAGGGARPAEIVRACERFDIEAMRERLTTSGIDAICRHADGYPRRMLEAADAPAVLHVAGARQRLVALASPDVPAVAIVGARRAGG